MGNVGARFKTKNVWDKKKKNHGSLLFVFKHCAQLADYFSKSGAYVTHNATE